jgi:pimeloyl-ACP methyl ester carboxylesterase
VRSSALAPALVTGLLLLGPAAFAAPVKPPKIDIRPANLAATPDFRWMFSIVLTNQDPAIGIYPDSITGFAEDLDPGKVDGPRSAKIPLSQFTRMLKPISAGESQQFNYSGNSYFERARVTLKLFAHTADNRKVEAQTTAEIGGGQSADQYASPTFEIDGRKVEYVFVRGARPPAPWPGLLLVHGELGNARRLLPFARQLAVVGYSVMLVSLPGYGISDGTPDLMGPASAAAIERAYQMLRSHVDVDTSKGMAAWGVSLGAGLVARFATRHPELKAVVLQGGVYDLWAVARARGADGTKTFVSAAGKDSTAWRDRSAAKTATRIASPVLMIHSERDLAAPIAQAKSYADVLRQGGSPVELKPIEGADRPRPLGQTADVGIEFIERKVALRIPGPSSGERPK